MFSLYMIVVTLGFITGASMETCPEAEDIYPCRCKEDEYGYITVKCSSDLFNNLENRLQLKLLQQALSSLKGKNCRLLILTDFTIRIPSNFFAGLSIYYLEVDSCRVDFLTNDDQPELLGLENHLVVLEFKGSSTVPPKLNLGHLKKLRELKLYRNNIPELRDDWLSSGPSSLRYLYIQGNNITKIGSNAFSKLSNLERLWLDDNRFGEIRRSLFPTTADRLDALSLENMVDCPSNWLDYFDDEYEEEFENELNMFFAEDVTCEELDLPFEIQRQSELHRVQNDPVAKRIKQEVIDDLYEPTPSTSSKIAEASELPAPPPPPAGLVKLLYQPHFSQMPELIAMFYCLIMFLGYHLPQMVKNPMEMQ